MGSLAQQAPLSVEDYLLGEETSAERHEYLGGQVYAMTGASRAHGLITGNLVAALRPLIRGTGCQLFASDMKVRLQVACQEIFYYPDLLLTCDPNDRANHYCVAPCLIVEVLSEATARIDRHEKALAYRTLPSLQEYWLIDEIKPRIERYWRAAGWSVEILTCGSLKLECIDAEIPLATIYEDVLELG